MRDASFALAIAAAGTALTASPALAGNSRELVRYDDLRLTTAEGQAELQKRLLSRDAQGRRRAHGAGLGDAAAGRLTPRVPGAVAPQASLRPRIF